MPTPSDHFDCPACGSTLADGGRTLKERSASLIGLEDAAAILPEIERRLTAAEAAKAKPAPPAAPAPKKKAAKKSAKKKTKRAASKPPGGTDGKQVGEPEKEVHAEKPDTGADAGSGPGSPADAGDEDEFNVVGF